MEGYMANSELWVPLGVRVPKTEALQHVNTFVDLAAALCVCIVLGLSGAGQNPHLLYSTMHSVSI